MISRLSLKIEEGDKLSRYFFLAMLWSGTPTILLGFAAAFLVPEKHPSVFFRGDATYGWTLQFFLVALIVPLLETCILIFPTAILSDLIAKRWMVAIIGSAPLSLLHLVVGWEKVIVISIFFAVQAFCFLELRRSGRSVALSFFFVTLVHGLFNGSLLFITFINKSY